ncbi:MAG: IPTL-CTERM sorting domain-containing protein [Bacteroidia bacterium]
MKKNYPILKIKNAIRISIAILVMLFKPTIMKSQCITLTPAQMQMSSSEIIYGVHTVINLGGLGNLPFSNGGDPVTGIKILPPVMLNPVANYVPGTHYTACVDAGAGTGQITFNRGGVYMVRVNRLSGNNDTLQVLVLAEKLQTCAAGGAPTEFPCPVPTHAFEGSDTEPTLRFPGSTVVNSVAALAAAIAAAAGAGQIDVTIVDHGFPGGISINGNNISEADAANLAAICALKGKIKSLTLISCSTGKGAAGAAFLKKLSECLGGIPVTAYTEDLTRWKDSLTGPTRWGIDGTGTSTTVTSPVKEVKKVGTLLPPQGPYKSIPLIPTNYPFNIAIRNIVHTGWSPIAPPPSFPNFQTYNFTGNIQFELSNNGPSGPWQPMTAFGPVVVVVHNVGNAGPVEHYQTEMQLLNLSGGSLPPGVMIRESPTLQSLGETEIRPLTGGEYGFSSFFDVFTELSVDGGQTWMPALSGPTEVILDGPAIVAIPTLGEWGLISFSVLLLGAGVFFIKRRMF